MRYIKTYETIKDRPKVGEFVIVKDNSYTTENPELSYFINNSIGEVIGILPEIFVEVKFENIPHKFKNYFSNSKYCKNFTDLSSKFPPSKIVAHSFDKEELKIILQQNKYNL